MNARRIARSLAALLRRVADKLDPPPAPMKFGPGEQMRMANEMCDRIKLVRALRASLRRYSPEEQPGEA